MSAARRLELRQVWRGIEGGTSYVQCDDFGPAVHGLYMIFPERWARALAERLEHAYRLKYAASGDNTYCFTGIPDGGFKTIGVPVLVARLGDAYNCLDKLSSAAELTVPIGGRLELRLSAVNPVTGRDPSGPSGPRR